MKIQKKVPIKVGFTDKSRDANAEKAKAKWEDKGWTVVNRINAGMASASYLELEKEDVTQVDENQNLVEPSLNSAVTRIIISLVVIFVFVWGELSDGFLTYDESQSEVAGVLSAIYSEKAEVEQRFKSFSDTLSSGDILGAIRGARKNEEWLMRHSFDGYLPKVGKNYKDIDDKNTINMLEDLISYAKTSNIRLQIYYDDFLEYIDNQKPSLLVKVEDSLDSYQSVKHLVVANSFVLGEKYNLGYDDYLEHWRTKENIEDDETKRAKEQKEAKKNRPFLNPKKYKKSSAEYALAKFITALQYRDFKDMAKYTQTSWRERNSSPHGDLANSFDSKYLISANLGKPECKRSLCNIPVSIKYRNRFDDKVEAHTIKPNVIKENSKWGVNPISALRKY